MEKSLQALIKKSLPAGRQGFTMFYALLVSSLALSIGAAIFDLTVREISLSGAATQSQYAVYASDGGAECALYWDNRYVDSASNNNGGSNSLFPTSTANLAGRGGNLGLRCNGIDITSAAASVSATAVVNAATTTFTVMGTNYKNQTPCAVVYVAKVGNPSITTITSHGYNTCAPGPLQLERVFQVSY